MSAKGMRGAWSTRIDAEAGVDTESRDMSWRSSETKGESGGGEWVEIGREREIVDVGEILAPVRLETIRERLRNICARRETASVRICRTTTCCIFLSDANSD